MMMTLQGPRMVMVEGRVLDGELLRAEWGERSGEAVTVRLYEGDYYRLTVGFSSTDQALSKFGPLLEETEDGIEKRNGLGTF